MRSAVFCFLLIALSAGVCRAAWNTQDRPKSPQAQLLQELRARAEYGDAGAQFNLGLVYAKGDGVRQDDVKAARWFRKAAVQGTPDAQFYLGARHERGDGVPQDYVQDGRG